MGTARALTGNELALAVKEGLNLPEESARVVVPDARRDIPERCGCSRSWRSWTT